VQRDPKDLESAGDLHHLHVRQPQSGHGHEHGRRRFYRQALRSGGADGQGAGHAAPDLRIWGREHAAGARRSHPEHQRRHAVRERAKAGADKKRI